MLKKRELTVESWSQLMQRQRQIELADVDKFMLTHVKLGHDLIQVEFEMQMADRWLLDGMQVYDFDKDFASSILTEKWAELLPYCIANRPFDCFYMKLPCGEYNEGTVVGVTPVDKLVNFKPEFFPGLLDGPGLYVGSGYGTAEPLVVNTGSELLAVHAYAISKTLDLMLDDTEVDYYPRDLVVNGLAYVCSTNADIVPTYKPQKNLKKNNAKKRSCATWYDVGYHIGSELRSYERTKREKLPHQGGTVRPHMRRAHWHHYWTGPKDGDRKLILKWTPPAMINVKKAKITSATSHSV